MPIPQEREALDAYSSLVSYAAERVGPAVVKIETEVGRGSRRGSAAGQGSGVIFRRDGQILTNAHVVEGARVVQVTLVDGRTFQAGVQGADRRQDIACLRIGARELPVAELSERPLKVGQLVIAVGNPYGLGWTVTAGVVSALDRELPNPRGGTLEHLIQTDAPINPGSSGGPLVDTQGRIVGITTAIVPFAQGLGFAIPTATALLVLARLSRVSNRHYPGLGIGAAQAPIPEWLAAQHHLKNKMGVLVLEIKPGSPAERASLKLNDLIVELDGKPVQSPLEISKRVARMQSGDSFPVVFLRNGKRRQVTVNL